MTCPTIIGEAVDARALSDRLNEHCACVALDRPALIRQATAEGATALAAALDAGRLLYADSPVYLSARDHAAMLGFVSAIETVAFAPGRAASLSASGPDTGPRGLFMGFDFHIGPDGPRLIEINTNAGGALLNAFAATAQSQPCAASVPGRVAVPADIGERIVAMVEAEWQRFGRAGLPARIAIVDENPRDQFLYPEFELARDLLTAAGIEAAIADPSELELVDAMLLLGGRPVDLVYNRLCDFDLSRPAHHHLRQAWRRGVAAVSPNPFLHAAYADKRNLAIFGDQAAMVALGVDPAVAATVAALVPQTRAVASMDADRLWRERENWFFKPATGFGAKAAYRGAGVTRRVFDAILAGDYVAQSYVPAPARRAFPAEADTANRYDVRVYACAGEPLMTVARLYRGQTTNFRSPGGGFAPVILIDDPADMAQTKTPAARPGF